MSTLNKVQQWLADAIGSRDDFKPKDVTPITAHELAAFWFAVNKISGDIAQLPLCPFVRTGDREVSQDVGSNAYNLLREESNPLQTAHTFKQLMTSHALVWGNGRAYVRRNRLGEPIELIPMLPDRTETVVVAGEKFHICKPHRDDRLTLFEDITSTNAKDTVAIRDSECLHVMGYTLDGIAGVSVVEFARRSLQIGASADARSAKQMTKGFTGKVFFEAPLGSFRKEDDAKEFIQGIRKSFSADDDGEVAGLLREGVSANVLNMSNDDMQFIESRGFQRQEIMLWFGLESMPGDKDSVSYNSLAQKSLAYYQGTLSRWCDQWVQACNKTLRSDQEKRQQNRFFKFITAATLRGTTKERFEVYQIGRQMGVLSANDVREMEDMNPREGGDDYGNPAITPGSGTDVVDNSQSEDTTSSANASASRLMLENLIGVEQNKAKNAVKSRNFLNWMDKFYPKWEQKLADAIESIGGDRDLAQKHCAESQKMLLDCADRATVETMSEVVSACVDHWKSRVDVILQEMELANV